MANTGSGDKVIGNTNIHMQARFLAIPDPYYWEIIQVPPGSMFSEIRAHYLGSLSQAGYDPLYDDIGKRELYLLKMRNQKQTVIIQYIQDAQQPVVLLFITEMEN